MRTPLVLGAQVGGVYRRHVGFDYGQYVAVLLLLPLFFFLERTQAKSRGQQRGGGRRLLVPLKVTIVSALLDS